MLYLVETIGPTGLSLYFIVFNQLGQVWRTTLNAGAGGWETYDSGHWAQYVILLTEKAGSGYYSGAYPPNITGYLTTEVIYNNAVPTLGDAPYGLGQSQGANVAAVGGIADVAPTLQRSLTSMVRGKVIAGTLTASAFTTDVINTETNAFKGRAIYFASGTLAGQGGIISEFEPITGLITIAGTFTVAPALNDVFVIS